MVIRKKWYGIAAVLLLTGGLAWHWYAGQTPEMKMRKVIAELADCASKSPGDGTTSGVVKLHRAQELFTDPCRIDVYRGMFGGEISQAELQSRLARYRSSFAHVRATAEVESLRTDGPDAGKMELTGSVHGVLKGGGRVAEDRALYCEFRRDDKGKWRISRLQVREILER